MTASRIFPLLLGAAFVLFAGIFVLGDYQNHAGDFGQYVIQARNLLLGRPWDYLVEGLPSVPPGYSFLLAILTWVGGVSAYHYALLNSVMWALASILAFHTFKNEFKNEVTAYLFLVAVLCTPYILYFQQVGVPNITYAASCMLALYAISKNADARNSFVLILALLLPALIRTEAIALYLALSIYFCCHRRWRLLGWSLAGVALTVFLDVILSHYHELSSNFIIVSAIFNEQTTNVASDADGVALARVIVAGSYMLLSYALGFTEFFVTPATLDHQFIWKIALSEGLSITAGPISVSLTIAAAVGYLIRPLTSLDRLFFTVHLVVISAFLLVDGVPIRYLTPLVPIFVFYVILFIELLCKRLAVGLWLQTGLISLLLAVTLGSSVPTFINMTARSNSLFTEPMEEIVRWVSLHRQNRPVAYYKERLMTMYLDIRSPSPVQARRFRSITEAAEILQDRGIVIVRKIHGYKQNEILEVLRRSEGVTVLWEDRDHAALCQVDCATISSSMQFSEAVAD